MSDTSLLLIDNGDDTGAVRVLRLNRPAKLNAIDNPLAEALLAAIDEAERDTAVRALVLCGAGRAFCAGRDVSAAPTDDDLRLVQGVSRALVASPLPVVCAVHGWVVGAGLEWMLDTDITVAAHDARFRLPDASLGAFVTGGSIATLPRAAGLQRAKALMLLGDTFSADEARAWGLVWQVVERNALDATALALARRLAALSPDVARRFKRVLNDVGLGGFDAAIDIECAMQRELMALSRTSFNP